MKTYPGLHPMDVTPLVDHNRPACPHVPSNTNYVWNPVRLEPLVPARRDKPHEVGSWRDKTSTPLCALGAVLVIVSSARIGESSLPFAALSGTGPATAQLLRSPLRTSVAAASLEIPQQEIVFSAPPASSPASVLHGTSANEPLIEYEHAAPRPSPTATITAPPAAATEHKSAGDWPRTLAIDSVHLVSPVALTRLAAGAWEVPAFAAGYLEGTSLLGHPGNVVIAGHVDTQGAVFRHLKDVRVGDVIDVSSVEYGYRYAVTRIFHASTDDRWLLDQGNIPRLTLITCWPDFFTARAPYNSLRLIVQAE